MSFISDMIMGKMREELRKRVEEILEAGREWRETAIKLTEALNHLSDTIEKNMIDTGQMKQISRAARTLSKNTKALTRAFDKMNETLTQFLKL